MAPQPDTSTHDLESRLTALEVVVSKLKMLVEPPYAVANTAAPVALPFLKEAAQHEFSAKFFTLLDLGEALLKYSAGIAFAGEIQRSGPMAEYVMSIFQQPPSLGKLSEGLRKVLDDPASTEWPIDMIRKVLRKPNNKPTSVARYLMDEFISVRNAERGHGAHQPEGYYESLYLRNHITVQDCVEECRYVNLPLVHVHAVDHDKGRYSYKATLLMGGAPVRMPELIVTAAKVRVGSTCLWDGEALLLVLNDFVAYKYCEKCALEHVFFAEQITNKRVSFHSYFGNHRITEERTRK